MFRADEAWFVFSDGRRCLRKREQPARPPSGPMILRDSIDPIRGPDLRMHDSLSSFRRSCRPDGNPQGERYFELGDQELPAFQPPEFDRKERRDAIRAGIEDVKAGRMAVTGETL